MSKSNQPQRDTGMMAVLHLAGGVWRVLIASVSGGRPSLVESGDYRPGEAPRIEELLERHRVGRVIGVLPAASVVCRTSILPNADPEQLDQALRLQAEAHLLGNAPEHRLAMSVLPAAPGETSRSGIILAWPESAPADIPPTARPVTFAPDIAGLAALLDGLRPADPLMWLDRAGGSVALALTHANGAVFRGTREEASSRDEWRQRVRLVLAETALSGGHTAPFVESLVQAHEEAIASVGADQATLIMPQEIIDNAAGQIAGAGREANWWSKYGIAAGVLLAATGEFAALTALQDAPAIKKPSRISNAAVALSRPRTATLTVIACLLILALAPLATSGLRLGVLKLKYPELAAELRQSDRHKTQLAMYDALKGQAWSSTKLLSDIVSNAPEGITLNWVHLNRLDDSVSIRGEVKRNRDGLEAFEVVSAMVTNLNDSGIFGMPQFSVDNANAFGIYEFNLSTKIENPHRRKQYKPDDPLNYKDWPLADRMAGKGPPTIDTGDDRPAGEPTLAGQQPPASTDPDDPMMIAGEPGDGADGGDGGSDPSDGGPRGHLRGSGGDAGGANITNPAVRAPGAVNPSEIPPPLTEAQVDAMTAEEVKDHLLKVARAKNHLRSVGGDENAELLERLKREQDMLMAKLRENK